MVIAAAGTRPHPAWFFGPAALIVAAATVLAGRLDTLPRAEPVALGLVVDLAVLIPALYAFVMVRGRGASKAGVATLALLGLVLARLLVPVEHLGALSMLPAVAGAAELALLLFVGFRLVRRAGKVRDETGDDLYDRLRRRLADALPSPLLAGVLAYEATLFAYALRLPRFLRRNADPREEREEQGRWTYHRTSGYGAILAALLMAGVGELIAGHLLLMRFFGPTAAWVHLALSGYGLLWLLGDYRATRARPHEMTADALALRCGLRGQARVPWSLVRSVEAFDWRDETPEGCEHASLTVFGRPDFLVELREPVEVVGFYGRTRRARTLGIGVDDAASFRRAVAERLSVSS